MIYVSCLYKYKFNKKENINQDTFMSMNCVKESQENQSKLSCESTQRQLERYNFPKILSFSCVVYSELSIIMWNDINKICQGI